MNSYRRLGLGMDDDEADDGKDEEVTTVGQINFASQRRWYLNLP